MTNETIEGIKRLSWLPDREDALNGTLIGGQEYYDVYITGGLISGLNNPLPIADGGTGQITANAALNALLPSQTGNGGKALKTDGTNTSWSTDTDTGITQLTGDITAGPGSGSQAATLATVNANVGSFGNATNVSTVTVNAKGLVTAASNTAIQIAESQVTNLTTDLAGKQPIDASLTSISGTSWVQGDLPYWSGTDTAARLVKDTNATRYISNQGTSNDPSWNQVNLANGVTGDLPFSNITQLAANTVACNPSNGTADIATIALAASQILGRGSSGDIAAIGLTGGLSMSGATLSSGNFFVGAFTRDISQASGNVAYTGVGFMPRALIAFANVGSTAQASWGLSIVAAEGYIADNNGVSAGTYVSGAALLNMIVSSGNTHIGQVASFDADGFTITYTKAGTPTGTATIKYLALK